MRGFGDYESCDTASAIKARDHKDATDLVIEPPILIDRAAFNQGINAQYNTHISDDPVSPSLVARGPHAVATSDPVLMRQREGKPGGGKGPLLSTDKSLTLAGSNDQTLFTPIRGLLCTNYSFDTQFGSNAEVYEDKAPPLKASQQSPSIANSFTMAVRRLTPLECERLMGWPDGWTATKADGTPQSDTHRYKQCGNGIASPVAQWIAQQLLLL